MIRISVSDREESDDRAFMEALYHCYSRLIYSEIKKHVQSSWDIEDLMQTVVIKLMEKLPRLRSLDRSQQLNYIIVTARHLSLNYLRDRKRKKELAFDEITDQLEDSRTLPEYQLEKIESAADLARAWRSLDERSRYLLEAKYILEKSNAEIGAETGVSSDSVRMLLTRARRKLRELLAEKEGSGRK